MIEFDRFSSRWQLVDVITEKLADYPEELETWRKAIMAAALLCLKVSYSQSKDPSASLLEQEQSVLETLQKLLVGLNLLNRFTLGDTLQRQWLYILDHKMCLKEKNSIHTFLAQCIFT